MIAISINEFLANDVTETQVTLTGALPGQDVEAGVDVYAYVYSDIQGIELSLDGNSYSDEVRLLSNGTHTIYVRCGNVPGTYTEAVGYTYIDENDGQQDGYFTVTVSGGTPPKFESISVSLAARSATLQYSANVVNTALTVGATLTGNILDHRYSFEIERIAEQGNKAAISGASFVNDLVNKLVIYEVEYEGGFLRWKRPTLTDHLNAISAAIGIDIIFRGADFYPKSDINVNQRQNIVAFSFYEVFSGSFGEHINRLIGWSDTVPGMTYNLYIDGGKIYIIQRGYEENTFTPVNWTLRPTLTHTIRRTQWADSQYQDVVPKEISSSDASNSNEPFSGTLTWGTVNPTTLVYEDGYLTEETRGNITTAYTYVDLATGGKTLLSKTIDDVDNDTHTVVTYTYETTGQQEYLYEEKTVVTEGAGDGTGITLESSIIRHVPIGGGWYGTTTYDTTDGTEVEVSSSLGQGAPGQKVSQYMVDAQNDALKPDSAPRQMTVPLTGVAKARQTYPVADYDTLEAIANSLDQYEGVEEIMLQGEIAGGSHVYTFNDKIVFNGNTYYIVSNSVSQTYNQVRQSITATRWVLS